MEQEGVARYLKDIVPPVLACFTDQDARVRYYACESMYNIAKVAKGEILLFFNDIFDALCKVRPSCCCALAAHTRTGIVLTCKPGSVWNSLQRIQSFR